MTSVRSDVPAAGVARLRLDGVGTLNALDEGAKGQLIGELRRVQADAAVRVVVITGAGRAFCAGGDVRAMGERTATDTVDVLERGRVIIDLIAESAKPVIAAVNGLASGAGFNLALACDVLLAAPDAWFQQSFVRMGLAPDMGGSFLLTQAVGVYRAKHALLTGERISSERALELGFVAQILRGDFDAETVAFAANLAARPPRAMAMTKQLASRGVDGTLSAALDRETLAQAVLSTTEDHRAAVSAFQAKEDLDRVTFRGV